MADERGEIKKHMQMVEEGWKMKCDITIDLFSQRERRILDLLARLSPYLKI
jgi:hypothetical protein